MVNDLQKETDIGLHYRIGVFPERQNEYMKIAILSVGDYRHITMISKYVRYFEQKGIAYDVICTDRYQNTIERKEVKTFPFFSANTKVKKIVQFFSFHQWAKKRIITEGYEFIVVWNENTALLFFDLLLSRYKNRYCVNIRDVDFLNQTILNIFRSKVIKSSSFSTYCSTSKLDFPKNYKYVLMRSLNLDVLEKVPKNYELVKEGSAINIVYIGKVRFYDACDDIISAFGNDDRFQIWFIGSGSEELIKYSDRINNIHLVGAYEPEETAFYLQTADVINSYFGTKVLGYERMSSIRFSYAPYIHIPVIVGQNTNMEEEGEKYGFAYGFGKVPIEEEADRFFKWYTNIQINAFISGCDHYCSDVKKADDIFYSTLERTIERIK